jgi:hypothetical protein
MSISGIKNQAPLALLYSQRVQKVSLGISLIIPTVYFSVAFVTKRAPHKLPKVNELLNRHSFSALTIPPALFVSSTTVAAILEYKHK